MTFLQQIEQHRDEIRRLLGTPTHGDLALQLTALSKSIGQQLAALTSLPTSVTIYDEGALMGIAAELDFLGSGVTSALTNQRASITIPNLTIGQPVTFPPSLATGLTAHWDMDEASGNAIDSHGAHDLTDNNTVTSAAGLLGTSRQLTSANTEFFSRADHADFNPPSKLSFAASIYDDGGSAQACIAMKGDYGASSWSWALQKSPAGGIRIFLTNSASDAGVNWADYDTVILAAATWYHVLLVIDTTQAVEADRVRFYLNGVAQVGSPGTELEFAL